MPGSNCAIVGCGTCSVRNRGVAFFSIRQSKHQDWEKALVRAVNRCDESFNLSRATICSRHFTPECIRISESGKRRSLKPGSLPTLWMPQRSVETSKLPARKPPTDRHPPEIPETVAYYNFGEVQQAAESLPSPWIKISSTEEQIVLAILDDSVLRFKVNVRSDFVATTQVYGLPVPTDVNIESIHLKSFLMTLNGKQICEGVTDYSLQEFAKLPSKGQLYFRHVLCKSVDEHTSAVRATKCVLLLDSGIHVCEHCSYVRSLLHKKRERAVKSCSGATIRENNPLKLPAAALKKALKKTRLHSKRVENKLITFQNKLSAESVQVSESMHGSLKSVMEGKVSTLNNPLTKLFWEEQLKAFSCKGKKGMRWHPMMVRLAILLHSRSPAAYDTLRKTGVLHLPGESTLQDYTNVLHPSAGFNKATLDLIKEATKDFTDNQRFVALLHDEMTIKSDLVFDQRSGEMVGFVSGGEELATHALVFYVVGVNTSLSMSLGYFGTPNVTADAMYPLFWRAVGLLEQVCNLKVISSTSDKATPNQRLYDMQGTNDTYKTQNHFAKDRELFFISDPPHLMKTMCNNLSSSGAGKNTRYLWRNGKNILWKHVVDIYQNDCGRQLKMTRLSHHHVHLTPSSVMNVRLAVQVLSETVGKVMQQYGGEDAQETADLILLMDKFFDCMNVRSNDEGKQKRKPFLKPYTDVNDERFKYLDELLQFFLQWKQTVQEREGFTQSENVHHSSDLERNVHDAESLSRSLQISPNPRCGVRE